MLSRVKRPIAIGAAVLLGLAAGAALTYFFVGYPSKQGRLVGHAPPEVANREGTWLGTKPLSWLDLRGRVVLLEFGFQNCPACRKMEPELDDLHKRYAAKGLFVLYVEDGRVTPLPATVRDAWTSKNVPYAALYDAKGEVSNRFGIDTYPHAYVVDRGGRVVWDGFPLKNLAAVESAIVDALGE
jgi:thiol-disulfide isomerase/thioredoxin